jgi:hypothetical protein
MNAPSFEVARLRQVIESNAEAAEVSLTDLTVMSTATDPYRMDTPANHRDAAWLAKAWQTVGAKRPIHLRGLHYALVSAEKPLLKPDDSPYLNTLEDWTWMQGVASRARWLGYVAFGDIVDERNAPPIIETIGSLYPVVRVEHNAELIETPSWDEVLPTVNAETFLLRRQTYRLV